MSGARATDCGSLRAPTRGFAERQPPNWSAEQSRTEQNRRRVEWSDSRVSTGQCSEDTGAHCTTVQYSRDRVQYSTFSQQNVLFVFSENETRNEYLISAGETHTQSSRLESCDAMRRGFSFFDHFASLHIHCCIQMSHSQALRSPFRMYCTALQSHIRRDATRRPIKKLATSGAERRGSGIVDETVASSS